MIVRIYPLSALQIYQFCSNKIFSKGAQSSQILEMVAPLLIRLHV